MKKLFLLTIVSLMSIAYGNDDKVSTQATEDETNSMISTMSTDSGITETVQGKWFESKDGYVFFFNEKDKGIFNNAFTFLSDNKEKLSILENVLSGEVSYEYHLHYNILINKENNQKILLAVSNENGHDFVHSLSDDEKNSFDAIIFIYEMAKLDDHNFKVGNSNNNQNTTTTYSSFNWNVTFNFTAHSIIDEGLGGVPGDSQCTSGGPGSTSCQVDDIYSGCSVSCGSGYYACCKGSNNTCFCKKKDK